MIPRYKVNRDLYNVVTVFGMPGFQTQTYLRTGKTLFKEKFYVERFV